MYKMLPFFVFGLLVISNVDAQKIDYVFGEKSDVIDSISSVIGRLKTWHKSEDSSKLIFFASTEYLEGDLFIHINCFVKGKSFIWENVVAKSNRIIRLNDSLSLPVVFKTDILCGELNQRAKFATIGGYSIRIVRGEQDDSWHTSGVFYFF